jgi:hypothetical protein
VEDGKTEVMGMGSFRRVLYDVFLGITIVMMFLLAVYLAITMPNIISNPITSLETSLALSALYTAIIALLLYLRTKIVGG